MKTPRPSDFIYAEHASGIIAKGAMLARVSQPLALITSLAIEGGRTLYVRSLALVEEAGQMTCYLSNGCIDCNMQTQALEVLQAGAKKLIRYGHSRNSQGGRAF